MLTRSDILEVIARNFPHQDMATGVDCAAEIVSMFNSHMANLQQTVSSQHTADNTTRAVIADLLVNAMPQKKIQCIKEYRGAFGTSLKDSKDAIEDAFRRNGFDNSGRKFTDSIDAAEDPTITALREKLTGNPWDTTEFSEDHPTYNTDPINRDRF